MAKKMFYGIKISDSAIRQALEQVEPVLHDLKLRGAPFRRVPPENLHLTLAFLGLLHPEQEAKAISILSELGDVPQFTLELSAPGAFPHASRASVLYVAVTSAEPLLQLQRKLNDLLKIRQLPSENRPFVPHLTVARLRPPVGLNLGAALPGPEIAFQVQRLELFESVNGPGGSQYHALGVKELKPSKT